MFERRARAKSKIRRDEAALIIPILAAGKQVALSLEVYRGDGD
jgi:hypothetical protein